MDASMEDVSSAADRTARVALSWLAEPGNRAMWTKVQQLGAPTTLEQLLAGDIDDESLRTTALAKLGGFAETRVLDPRRLADATLRRAKRLGARIVIPGDAEWPRQLDDLAPLEPD